MTGKERLLHALNGEPVDRVPVTLFIQSQGHFVNQLDESIDPWDFYELQKKVIDYQRSLGLDVHVRMLFFIPQNPVFAHFDLLNVSTQNENWKVETVEEEDGATKNYHHTITTPDGVLTQTFSINENRKGTFMYSCTESPLKTEEDIRIAMKYEPMYSDEIKAEMKNQVARIKEYLGGDGIVSAWCNGGMFNSLAGIYDQSELYSLFLVDEELYELLMEFAKKRVYDYTQAVLDSGIDALCVRGNSAGGFVGNRCFSEYIMPYEKEYIEFCQKDGTPVIYHNCGTAKELLPSYKEMGAKNIEPWSPSPMGDRDFALLQKEVGDAFSITTGVNQVDVLQNGTLEDVRTYTLEAMEAGKKLNSFIMQNCDFLEYGTPLENVAEYAKVALENASK